MKRLVLVALVFALIASASAALTRVGFKKGGIYLGPAVGYSSWGALAYGANGEYGVTDNIGVGGDIAITHFTERYGGYGDYWYEWSYTLTGVLIGASYHFTPGKQFDPYGKLGLGFFNWSVSYKDNEGSSGNLNSAGYSSGVG